MKEEWRDVIGYEGLYRVSSFGNVYSFVKKRTLTPSINGRGYFLVGLTKNKVVKSINVHRLIATAFIKANGKPQVNHIDGNKLNNHSDNLEWVTQNENMQHAYDKGLQKPSHHQKQMVSQYCKENYSKKVVQMDMSGKLVAEYYSLSEAARQTGAFQGNISKVCRGKMNKTHNYTWKYA
jgi:hypothetical protein